MRFVDEIQRLSEPIIDDCLVDFLKQSWNEDERQYPLVADEIRENLIHQNYLSQKDIELMLQFDVNKLSDEDHFVEIKSLYEAFVELYKTDE